MKMTGTSAFILLLQQVNEINKNIVTPEVIIHNFTDLKVLGIYI